MRPQLTSSLDAEKRRGKTIIMSRRGEFVYFSAGKGGGNSTHVDSSESEDDTESTWPTMSTVSEESSDESLLDKLLHDRGRFGDAPMGSALPFDVTILFNSPLNGQVDFAEILNFAFMFIKESQKVRDLLVLDTSIFSYIEVVQTIKDRITECKDSEEVGIKTSTEKLDYYLKAVDSLLLWIKLHIGIIGNRRGELNICFPDGACMGLSEFKHIIDLAVEVATELNRVIFAKKVQFAAILMRSFKILVLALEVSSHFELQGDKLSFTVKKSFAQLIAMLNGCEKIVAQVAHTEVLYSLQAVCFANMLLISSRTSPISGFWGLDRYENELNNVDDELDSIIGILPFDVLADVISKPSLLRIHVMTAIAFYLNSCKGRMIMSEILADLLRRLLPSDFSLDDVCQETLVSIILFAKSIEGKKADTESSLFVENTYFRAQYSNFHGAMFLSILTLMSNIFSVANFRLYSYVEDVRIDLLQELDLEDEESAARESFVRACAFKGYFPLCCKHLHRIAEKCLTQQKIIDFVENHKLIAKYYCDMGAYDSAVLNLNAALRTLPSLDVFDLHRISLKFELSLVYLHSGALLAANQGFLSIYQDLKTSGLCYNEQISVLSWVVRVQLDLQNNEEAKRVMQEMKNIRAEHGQETSLCAIICRPMQYIFQSALPQYSICSHDADFGQLKAKMYLQSKLYVSALKSLTPTIVAVGLAANLTRSIDAMSELASLFTLRAEIQLEAAKLHQKLHFPFAVGSSQLFEAVKVMFDQDFNEENLLLLRSKLQMQNDINQRTTIIEDTTLQFNSCDRGKKYGNPGDLVVDARRWLQRANQIYSSIGDVINSMKTSQALASLPLDVMFVPAALLDIPLSKASFLGESIHPSTSVPETRRVKIEDSLRANKYSLKLSRLFPHPILTLNIYLNFAEIKVLQDSVFEAVVYWSEARDLFLHLFVDCINIPLIRLAPISLVNDLQNVVNRLIRLLFTFDKNFINQNIFMFDIYNMCSLDYGRVIVTLRKVAATAAAQITSVFSGIPLPSLNGDNFDAFGGYTPEIQNSRYSEFQENSHQTHQSCLHSEREVDSPAMDDLTSYAELSFWYPWISESRTNTKISREALLTENCWRCFTMINKVMRDQDMNLTLKNHILFRSLRSLSISMNSVRRITSQINPKQFTFDFMRGSFEHSRPKNSTNVLSTFSVNDAATSIQAIKNSLHASEWIDRAVYIMQVDEVLLVYNASTGRRLVHFLNIFSFPTLWDAIRAFESEQLLRAVAVEEPTDIPGGSSGEIVNSRSKSKRVKSVLGPSEQTDSQFSSSIARLIFDFATDQSSVSCTGGVEERLASISSLRSGEFSGVVEFMHQTMVLGEFNSIETSSSSHSSKIESPIASVKSGGSSLANTIKSFIPLKVIKKLFPLGGESGKPPAAVSPVVLLCSNSLLCVPWELILFDIPIVRELSLVSWYTNMLARGKQFCGPRWNTVPAYMSFALNDIPGAHSKIINDIKSLYTHSKAVRAVRALSMISPAVAVVTKSAKSLLRLNLPLCDFQSHSSVKSSSKSHKISSVEDFFSHSTARFSGSEPKRLSGRYVSEESLTDLYLFVTEASAPCPSNIIPIGNSESSLKSSKLKRIDFFDMSLIAGRAATSETCAPVNSVLSWTRKNCDRIYALRDNMTPFPIFFLTYSDLIDVPDIILSILCLRDETVCIFIPEIFIVEVVKEIIAALEEWGPKRDGSKKSESNFFMSTGNEQDYFPAEEELSSRAFVYHIIMSKVAKLQRELGISIIVYI